MDLELEEFRKKMDIIWGDGILKGRKYQHELMEVYEMEFPQFKKLKRRERSTEEMIQLIDCDL